MARHKITRAKGRAGNHSFIQFPHRLICSARFNALSGRAVKVLMFLAAQYRGHNNGDLCAARKVAAAAGIKGSGNLQLGIEELIEAGIVILSRQGGRNRCSLYALAWFPIDECDGKLDIPFTRVAPIDYRELDGNGTLSGPPVGQCGPPMGQSAQIQKVADVH
jgi:hypothetical protein